ncbi:MAG: hypothetical protein IID50_01675 [Proteobacteria bacterium]|nr:hypothetical protein [Pseudomonadota bacterium]
MRCPASPQRTLRAENLGKPARRVMIGAPWYRLRRIPPHAAPFLLNISMIWSLGLK